jgi:Dolichyl-phosphate-mannose-protein mannosyltransferase
MTLPRAPLRWTRDVRSFCHGTLIAVVAASFLAGNTSFSAPPRFDGAGYAVLAEALLSGQGYREIDHPDRPLHAHYPPGYPLALAALWSVTGRSIVAAHALSFACTVGAILSAWWWFRSLYPQRTAFALGLALAVNWTWDRVGGSIQTEPLFLLLAQAALLGAASCARGGGVGRGVVLGLLLAACALVRHMGVCLAFAVVIDLWSRQRRKTALAVALVVLISILPWLGWLVMVQHNTQIALLARGSLVERVGGNALFYLRRLPDQLTGPLVEVGTVFRRSTWVTVASTAWAALASGVIVLGWLRTLRTARRRLAALVPLATLGLLLIWPFTEAGRFLVPLVPFLLVGAVEGLALLGAWARMGRPRARALAAVMFASVPYSAYQIVTDRAGAREHEQAAFSAACAWLATEATQAGPVLTRQPGEVYWLSRRLAIPPSHDDPKEIATLIDRYGVAYLLVDHARYAREPANPFQRFVASHPERVALVWSEQEGRVSVYAVMRSSSSGHGALERQASIILVAVKARLGERGGAHRDGLCTLGSVIVTAQREEPGCTGRRFATGRGERRPWDLAFDRPATVYVARLVESAVDHGDGLMAHGGSRGQGLEVKSAPREGQLQDYRTRIHLEFVVGRLFGVGLEEQLEDVTQPEPIVSLGTEGAQLGVGHGCGIIESVVIPHQAGAGALPGVDPHPEGRKAIDQLSAIPDGVVELAVDHGRLAGPSAGDFAKHRRVGERLLDLRDHERGESPVRCIGKVNAIGQKSGFESLPARGSVQVVDGENGRFTQDVDRCSVVGLHVSLASMKRLDGVVPFVEYWGRSREDQPGRCLANESAADLREVFPVRLELHLMLAALGIELEVVQPSVEVDNLRLERDRPLVEMFQNVAAIAAVFRHTDHLGSSLEPLGHEGGVSQTDRVADQYDQGQAIRRFRIGHVGRGGASYRYHQVNKRAHDMASWC